MAFSKITSAELVDKGVSGLPDVPGLSATDMQKKFDELSKDVVIPKFNKLIEDMESENGASGIGMEVPEGIVSDANTKAVVHALAKLTKENTDAKHGHENKSVLDMITGTVKAAYDRLVTLFKNITEVSDTVEDKSASLPTGKAIVAYVKKMGGGDMATSVYDKNESGVVDDAEKLGGELPEVFQRTTSADLKTDSKDVVGAINEVNEKAKNGGKDLIADAFSEETDYDAGVYVTYENKFWVFTAPKAAGEWDAAVVELVTVGGELSQLTQNIFGQGGEGEMSLYSLVSTIYENTKKYSSVVAGTSKNSQASGNNKATLTFSGNVGIVIISVNGWSNSVTVSCNITFSDGVTATELIKESGSGSAYIASEKFYVYKYENGSGGSITVNANDSDSGTVGTSITVADVVLS